MNLRCWDFTFELSFTKIIITGPDRNTAGTGFGHSVCSLTQQAGQCCCLHDFTANLVLLAFVAELCCAQVLHAWESSVALPAFVKEDKAPP